MIGVELTPGTHTVKMKYTPPGLNGGLFLLLIGLCCIVLFYRYDNKHNKVLAMIRENKKKGIYELPFKDDPEPVAKKKKAADVKKETEEKVKEELSADMIADELKKLKSLMDEGVLTKEEFDEQKKKLLNKKK
ncbi:MAG: SHOCT domain-containing protein [Oscillospiraceae bacterium]|nr:SHOCT domain-containing protein [Oscillospiraceae bacterium]